MKRILKIIVAIFASFQLSQASEFIIDTGHSNVGFSVKHMMITNVTGKFKSFDAELVFDKEKKRFTKMVATIDASSIDTGIEKRDNHLRSADFFEVEKFPNIVFEMTDSTDDTITGDLTIHGVTKPVVLEKTINGLIKDFQGNTRVGFTLEGTINRKDYGLKWNKILEGGGLTVGEEVKITVDAQAIEL